MKTERKIVWGSQVPGGVRRPMAHTITIKSQHTLLLTELKIPAKKPCGSQSKPRAQMLSGKTLNGQGHWSSKTFYSNPNKAKNTKLALSIRKEQGRTKSTNETGIYNRWATRFILWRGKNATLNLPDACLTIVRIALLFPKVLCTNRCFDWFTDA